MKVDHLEHLESLVFYGEEGARKALDILKNVDNYQVTLKYDGSPSLFFGYDEEGEFFLATKSIFNKTPKLNYNSVDIDKNHGTNEGLTKKLKYVFPILKEACDGQPRIVIQGDLMFVEDDLSFDGSYWCFKQNVIEYRLGGFNMKRFKLGLAIHTVYEMKDGNLNLRPDIPVVNYRWLDINNICIFYALVRRSRGYSNGYLQAVSEIEHFIDNKIIEYNSVDTAEALKAVNHVVRNGKRININNVLKEMPAWVDIKLIRLHQMISDAKHALIGDLNPIGCGVYADIGHEGYVVELPTGEKVKLVKREVFSFKNFEQWA